MSSQKSHWNIKLGLPSYTCTEYYQSPTHNRGTILPSSARVTVTHNTSHTGSMSRATMGTCIYCGGLRGSIKLSLDKPLPVFITRRIREKWGTVRKNFLLNFLTFPSEMHVIYPFIQYTHAHLQCKTLLWGIPIGDSSFLFFYTCTILYRCLESL